MTDCSSECCSVIDVHGLHALASLSANLRAVAIARLGTGEVGVPTVVWQEFSDLYEDEAADLAPHIARKITLSKKYIVGAASIADQLGARFPDGAYNRNADLYTGAIATVEEFTVVTSLQHSNFYAGMECNTLDIHTWAAA